MVTELKEATALESVLTEGPTSEEQTKVSEGEEIQETETKSEKEEKVVSKVTFTPEQETEIGKRVQSETDKKVKTYQEKHEANTAYIRSLQSQVKELKVIKTEQRMKSLSESILSGDEDEGLEVDKIEERRKALSEINERIKDYNEKSTLVDEVASLATSLTGTLDKRVVSKYSLSDNNPTMKAKGVLELVGDATHFIREKEAFDKIIEEIPLLQKGSEVRQQIDSFVERYLELSDEKGRDLLIGKLKQELSINPKRKPPTPSDGSGGDQIPTTLSTVEKIALALDKAERRRTK